MRRHLTAERPGMRLALRRISILLRRSGEGLDRNPRRSGGLYGWTVSKALDGARVGFFVGFITREDSWRYLTLDPPEAAVFAFVDPPRSRLHERLVERRDALFPRIAADAHRGGVPFEFHRDQSAALIRHRSVRGMPPEILALTSLDFFTTSFRAFWTADFFSRLRRLRPTRSRGRR